MADDGQVRLLAAKTIRSLQAEVDRLQRDNYLLRKEVGEEGRANRMTLLYESAVEEINRLNEKVEDMMALMEQDSCEIERLRTENTRIASFLHPVGTRICAPGLCRCEEARRG